VTLDDVRRPARPGNLSPSRRNGQQRDPHQPRRPFAITSRSLLKQPGHRQPSPAKKQGRLGRGPRPNSFGFLLDQPNLLLDQGHAGLRWSGNCARTCRLAGRSSAAGPLRRAFRGARQLRSAVKVGQPAPRANPFALNRTVDHPGEVLVSRAEVNDHLPDCVSRRVDDGPAGRLDHLRLENHPL
jgi:hypothetical protein